MDFRRQVLFGLLAAMASTATLAADPSAARKPPARAIPAPMPDHPGNVFLDGEAVTVPLAAPDGTPWLAVDYDGKTVAEGQIEARHARAGPLPVGWYDFRLRDDPAGVGRTSAAVLARLAAPTPVTSPIALDVAMAWFYKQDRMDAVASLCALAGVNWVRDRLNWAEVERSRGQFEDDSRYDASARAQAAAGLQILQVNHISPPWANTKTKRLPLDLRDAYHFYRHMARRWAGLVTAIEPWNEADIDMFGGHTGAEMASFQKASYLGVKAGCPETIACLNVFATPSKAILQDLHANECWPYFDTFNLHHYAPADKYPEVYAAFRAVSAGRPLWTTEFSMPVKWSGDEKRKEPSDADLRLQAERVAAAFAAALHEGPAAAFYFILPHYTEGPTQFGIIRGDLTPRPAYVALAAVGRLLADARPLGRVSIVPQNLRAFAFDAAPDGSRRDVLVAWTTSGEADLPLPDRPEAVFDHLGRTRTRESATLRVTAAPTFAVLARQTAARMPLDPPPAPPERLPGNPSPVVLQALWPKERIDLGRSAYLLAAGRTENIPVYAYNFSDKPVVGTLAVASPPAWKTKVEAATSVPPGGRAELGLSVEADPAAAGQAPATVRITGDFGAAGRPVLSINVAVQAN